MIVNGGFVPGAAVISKTLLRILMSEESGIGFWGSKVTVKFESVFILSKLSSITGSASGTKPPLIVVIFVSCKNNCTFPSLEIKTRSSYLSLLRSVVFKESVFESRGNSIEGVNVPFPFPRRTEIFFSPPVIISRLQSLLKCPRTAFGIPATG